MENLVAACTSRYLERLESTVWQDAKRCELCWLVKNLLSRVPRPPEWILTLRAFGGLVGNHFSDLQARRKTQGEITFGTEATRRHRY